MTNPNEVVNGLFELLLSRYEAVLETSLGQNDFIFDSVRALYYYCDKINSKHGCSHIDSPDWIKKKKKQQHR